MTTIGGFESWSTTLAGVLASAGVDGFLGNLASFYDQGDEEASEWETFLTAWEERYGDRTILVGDLVADIHEGKGDLRNALPSDVADAIDKGRGEKASQGFRVKLGKALRKREGRRYGARELHLEIAERDSRSGSPRWHVCAGELGSQGATVPFIPTDLDGIPF